MIMKLLLIIAVIAVVYLFFIKKKPVQTLEKEREQESTPTSDMVACSSCGVYIELEEAILSGAKYYCSKECIEKAS